jgi:hypothetical protein
VKKKKEEEKRSLSSVAVPYPEEVPSFAELRELSLAPANVVKMSDSSRGASVVEVKHSAASKKNGDAKKDSEKKQVVDVVKKEVRKQEPARVVVQEVVAVNAVVTVSAVDGVGDVKKRRKKKKKKKVIEEMLLPSVSEEIVPIFIAATSSLPDAVVVEDVVVVDEADAAPLVIVPRPVVVHVSMEIVEEVRSVVAPKKVVNIYEEPPRSIETALVVAKLFSACSFSAFLLVAGANLPATWKEGDVIELTVPEREVADAPLRQGEPLSGIVLLSSSEKVAELSVICSRIAQGPLATVVSNDSITLAAKGDEYNDVVPNWVSASLNWFAGLKYECLLVDTEHQEFCRDCAGAVLDFIKPPKDMDSAGLCRLRSWLPRLSGLVAKAPIPQRLMNAREVARVCFAASVAAPGSLAEIERLSAIREKVLALLRHDEWPSTVELHFNPVPASAAMGDDFAVTTLAEARLVELRFNQLVDRCLDEMLPQKCLPRSLSSTGKQVVGPIPVLVHWLRGTGRKDAMLLWIPHDYTAAALLTEAGNRFDVPASEAANMSLVLRRRGDVVMTLGNWPPLSACGLVAGDHLWIEDAWNTPVQLLDEIPEDALVTPDVQRGIRQIATWKEDGNVFLSYTYFMRITKHAARYPLVVTRASELPDPLSTVSPEDRKLMQARLVRVELARDSMEAYLAHLNYWMDGRSPSGALHRGVLAQPTAFTLSMDEPQTLMLMSQHEVRERIVYGEWDVENDSLSAAEETEDSVELDETSEQWEMSMLCEGCKFDNGRKNWARCEQCGLVNTRFRAKGGHLATLPDLNTVVYWNKEWHIAASKQYESRKRILSLGSSEIWVDRLRAFVGSGASEESLVGFSDEKDSDGQLLFRVQTSDTDPKQTQEVSMRLEHYLQLEPVEVNMELLLTTATGTPVQLDKLWTETPESEPRHPYVWIFGEPGVGKSWLSRHMCRLFNETGELPSWRKRFEAVTRVFLPDLLRSCSQYGDLITSKELLDAAWSLCNPVELGLNTVRVGSAYERRTEKVLWILDGYDEAERMLDLDNRRPGTNFRFMQGLAASSLYYLQNAIIFTRAAPELEMMSGTCLTLRGIAPQYPGPSVLRECFSDPFVTLCRLNCEDVKSEGTMVSWEDLKERLDVCELMTKNGVTLQDLTIFSRTVRYCVFGLFCAEKNPSTAFGDSRMVLALQDAHFLTGEVFVRLVNAFETGAEVEGLLKEIVVYVRQFVWISLNLKRQVSDSVQRNEVIRLVCEDIPDSAELCRLLTEEMRKRLWSRRPRNDLLHFVERHVIGGVLRRDRLETAARWIKGWEKVPQISKLLHNPLHVKLLCRVQRTRPDDEAFDWYLSPELPLDPRELLISELHRHAITPILLRKDNFDFAAGAVFGELELIKTQVLEEKHESAEGCSSLSSSSSSSSSVNPFSFALPSANAAERSEGGNDNNVPAAASSGAVGLPRDSIESQSVREFLISLWYMANPSNQPPLPRPSAKDQRWLFLLCLTPPSERWPHVITVATKLRDRIFKSKQAALISAPEDIKSLGSCDVVTLLELLRVAHSLDRNAVTPEDSNKKNKKQKKKFFFFFFSYTFVLRCLQRAFGCITCSHSSRGYLFIYLFFFLSLIFLVFRLWLMNLG